MANISIHNHYIPNIKIVCIGHIGYKQTKMKTNLKNVALIALLALFVLVVSYFQNVRQHFFCAKEKQKFNIDLIKIENRNQRPNLHQKDTKHKTTVVETLVKGKGNFKLEHPNGVKQNVISWSQYGQDLYVDKLLNTKKGGFFVEIGGFDGETFSNSLFFEKVRDWNGLLVEASPFMFEILLKKQRSCYMVNACISNSMPTMTFLLAGPLSSSNETLTDKHRKRIHTKKIPAEDKLWNHTGKQVEVTCLNFNRIMEVIGQTYIDYFSLDVEGAEMYILNSIEWENINIDVFTIETDQFRDQILSFMKTKGYKWIQRLQGDDVFRKI
ncbi:Hypothetical predicted protein [Mytilus galloprovincialis]|uniref:Methyltransferase FkbM domain-containing protein n=1 Tax=Mytilus galloprovincialis TaxID=29158 RepID=A0A8B6ERZ0_MYTGA|nr:Hypothetical predicted protein [Mytilus galloprovincialis]